MVKNIFYSFFVIFLCVICQNCKPSTANSTIKEEPEIKSFENGLGVESNKNDSQIGYILYDKELVFSNKRDGEKTLKEYEINIEAAWNKNVAIIKKSIPNYADIIYYKDEEEPVDFV